MNISIVFVCNNSPVVIGSGGPTFLDCHFGNNERVKARDGDSEVQ
jgi:hypothetical protein